MPSLKRYKYRCGFLIDLDACKRYFMVGHQHSYDDIKPCIMYSHRKAKKLSAAERRLYNEENLQFQMTEEFTSSFRDIRRDAPPEVRVRLVLPHAWMRWDQHEKYGKRLHHGLFLPTASGIGAKFREGGPTDVDRERLQIFIDTMNELLNQDGDRDSERAQFTPADFTFETIPERALSGPLFNPEETHELLRAGREALDLYGVTPREFLKAYY